MQTRYYRDRDGCKASTSVPLENNRELSIVTRRLTAAGGQLVTSANVSTLKDGYSVHVMGFGTAGGDFSQRVVVTSPARVTEKVVREQHEKALANIALITQGVERHYANTSTLNAKAIESVIASQPDARVAAEASPC
ncbi:hypothetical protein NU688_33135 [Variovorax sp. ZS18.2.2]|uniref:hypothetical protein n=1 Tax=Variovorax sp. ZS18.2.2 TaxID=2971255 RepID=UPI0021512D62|nr:hypothetical protein [Variovorax sp. ZS18.2.2]MCR6481043.1 hypothetical protein [Variovorax sp. ZS18.2.2]